MLNTKDEIKRALDKNYISNYIINDDLTVDVNGNVAFLNPGNLNYLQVQFNIVRGYFDFVSSKIKSLKGSPKIVYGWFSCDNNPLISLEHLPIIYGNLYCDKKFHNTPEYKRYLMMNSLRK